jgi:phospholipid/cholesterol/gamma-HCH transport system substrate-binding protein
MSKRSTRDIFFGLSVMLGLATFSVFSLKAANLTTFGDDDSYRIVARFDNIGGLKVRATVRSAGFVVGRVKSISLDAKSFQGVVEIFIKNEFVFPKDSSAKIQTVGLLGDQYIGIEAGDDPSNLKTGDSIAITYSAIAIERVIRQFLSGAPTDELVTPTKIETKKP